MKRCFSGIAFSLAAILLLTPKCLANKPATTKTKPDDATISLALKFTKKRPNALQRILSFLDDSPNGFATGFVVGNGLVMTAYHVVSGNLSSSKKVQLGFAPNDELAVEISVNGCRASVLKVDEDADLALLRICHSQGQVKTPAFQAVVTREEKLTVIARPRGTRMVRRGIFYGPYELRGQQYSLAKIDGHDGYSGSPVYNQKAEIIGVFSGYDSGQKLAMISPGIRAQKLLEDYVPSPKP